MKKTKIETLRKELDELEQKTNKLLEIPEERLKWKKK